MAAEVICQDRDVIYTVQHRQNCALRPERWGDCLDRAVEIVTLAGQQNDIVGAVDRAGE
jgi:hypothetical protein